MKKWLLPIAALCLMVVLPAFAGESVEASPYSEEALVAQTPLEPAAEEATAASEEAKSLGFLTGASALWSEPVAAACVPFQCRQECRAGCPPGCLCVGSCVEDDCDCVVICY